jgi:hypothetical protein
VKAQDKYKLKVMIKKAIWAEKQKTGKRPPKKVRDEAVMAIWNTMKPEVKEETFKVKQEPTSIKEILNGIKPPR